MTYIPEESKVVYQSEDGKEENIRDGFKFDPIEVQPHPDKPGKYRLLDPIFVGREHNILKTLIAKEFIRRKCQLRIKLEWGGFFYLVVEQILQHYSCQ